MGSTRPRALHVADVDGEGRPADVPASLPVAGAWRERLPRSISHSTTTAAYTSVFSSHPACLKPTGTWNSCPPDACRCPPPSRHRESPAAPAAVHDTGGKRDEDIVDDGVDR